MAATIKDVARQAKVSIASVSRALNGTGSITPATRERILRVAHKMQYTPHGTARSLITRRTHTIGVLLPDMHGEYFSELIRGIDRAARIRGMHLLVSSSHGDPSEANAMLRSRSSRVDGFLMMSPDVDSEFLNRVLPPATPAVLMNTRDESGRRSVFMADNFGGASLVTSHLLSAGYATIAHISGPPQNIEARERQRGYLAALTAQGHVPMFVPGEFTEQSGYRAGRAILALSPRPRAVFAANDVMAIGCLFAFTEAGVRVPDDIALVGFDDIPLARFMSPPLTTVRVDTAALGRLAFERLLHAIEKGPAADPPSREILHTELIVRNSCGVRTAYS